MTTTLYLLVLGFAMFGAWLLGYAIGTTIVIGGLW